MKPIVLLCASALFAASASAGAASWPTRPLTVVVPYAAGGSYDVVARQLAQSLSNTFQHNFIVENRPGAGGTLGAAAVAKAPADGHTLVFTGNASLANNQLLYAQMPYDGRKDFTPIAMVAHAPMIVAANVEVPGDTLAEVLKRNAGKDLNYGSPGNGTIGHLTGQLLNDLMGGAIQFGIGPAASYLGPTQAGRIKILAVASQQRLDSLPSVATASEQGIALESSAWMALAGPAGMDAEVVRQLNEATNRWTESEDGRKRLSDLVLQPAPGVPADLAAAIEKEQATWGPIIQQLGLKLD